MGSFERNFKVVTLAVLVVFIANTAEALQDEIYDPHWPITLSFEETKSNAKLGEALLKRVYARIGFTDNIIRAEVDTLFENLKEVIEKRLRKCERKRRRAGIARSFSHDPVYSHRVNESLANQYTPRRARY